MRIEALTDALQRAGIVLSHGLTDAELAAAEHLHLFSFPPDLADFLRACLPVGPRWPNWRSPQDPRIAESVAWPTDALLIDVQNDAFWLPAWGTRPDDDIVAAKIARDFVDQAPRLIPVYANRYLPATPSAGGNPVLSVYHADIIYCGVDLIDFLEREFTNTYKRNMPIRTSEVRKITFWSDIVENT